MFVASSAYLKNSSAKLIFRIWFDLEYINFCTPNLKLKQLKSRIDSSINWAYISIFFHWLCRMYRFYSDLRIRSAKQSRLVLALSCSSLTYLLDFLDEPVMTHFYDRDQQESREPRTNVILTEFSFPPYCRDRQVEYSFWKTTFKITYNTSLDFSPSDDHIDLSSLFPSTWDPRRKQYN